jgi:hypothetical protein
MEKKTFLLKEGIKAHLIETNLFKTNLICLMLTVPINKEDVTKNALIPFLLKRGTENLKDQYQINKKLEEMFGAVYDCGIDKVGDNQLIKFYIESVNENFLPKKVDILKESIETILDIIFNPIMENGLFKEEFAGKKLRFRGSSNQIIWKNVNGEFVEAEEIENNNRFK